MRRRWTRLGTVALAALLAASVARADDAGEPAVRVRSLRMRTTAFIQNGEGYQSRAGGGATGKGSERATIFQPQAAIEIDQGRNFTHQVFVPVDIVTAASPDAIDILSSASRQNLAITAGWTGTYHPRDLTAGARALIHYEENFRSWTAGIFGSRAFAEQNTVVSTSLNTTLDHFNVYNFAGATLGSRLRATVNVNAGVTQLLSPTTVVHLNVGATAQGGQLGNTWNTVPLFPHRLQESLPLTRQRLAVVGRIVQGLWWNESIRVGYRAYADTWGAVAHTGEVDFFQRLTPYLYLQAVYRHHTQESVSFYTELATNAPDELRTADSDLSSFSAQTVGGHLRVSLPPSWSPVSPDDIQFDLGYERYFRTNGLTVDVTTCGVGFLF